MVADNEWVWMNGDGVWYIFFVVSTNTTLYNYRLPRLFTFWSCRDPRQILYLFMFGSKCAMCVCVWGIYASPKVKELFRSKLLYEFQAIRLIALLAQVIHSLTKSLCSAHIVAGFDTCRLVHRLVSFYVENGMHLIRVEIDYTSGVSVGRMNSRTNNNLSLSLSVTIRTSHRRPRKSTTRKRQRQIVGAAGELIDSLSFCNCVRIAYIQPVVSQDYFPFELSVEVDFPSIVFLNGLFTMKNSDWRSENGIWPPAQTNHQAESPPNDAKNV